MEVPEGYEALIKTLQEMDIKPKADNPAEFQKWIKSFAEQQAGQPTVKKEPETKPATPSHIPYIPPPRISNFSGSKDKKSGETSYELWRYEVQCLMNDKVHSPESIAAAVRRSLKGEAGLVAVRLGPGATLTTLLEKMETYFGVVDEKETIMSEFYNARQKDDEDVSAWSSRLEGILDKAIYMGKVSNIQADSMLHDMLWKGLKHPLKDISHYEKERHTTFDKLRVALRRIEKEHNLDHATPAAKATAKQAVPTSTEESEMSGILKQISSRLDQLEAGQQQFARYLPQQRHQGPQQQQQQYRPRNFRGRGQRGRGRGYGRGFGQQPQQQTATYKFPPIKCNRCSREGHIARGCRFNTDVDGKPLN